ncbi:MAG TPA: hypothetical protein VF719_04960, partial [Abditibacteriaceae bacterium]
MQIQPYRKPLRALQLVAITFGASLPASAAPSQSQESAKVEAVVRKFWSGWSALSRDLSSEQA